MGGKTSTRAKNQYNDKAYDRIVVVVRKGRRDMVKDHASSRGKSVNAYITELIERDMGIEIAMNKERGE